MATRTLLSSKRRFDVFNYKANLIDRPFSISPLGCCIGDLNNGLVWYLIGPTISDNQMFCQPNIDLNSGLRSL